MEESKNQQLNLVQKLAKIRAIADVVQKDKSGYNYKYTDITEILAKVSGGMKKYGVSLIPSIAKGTSSVSQNVVKSVKFNKTGQKIETVSTEMLYAAEMVFTWINDDDPTDRLEVDWFVTGSQSDPSQALGSGLTYCTRYFLTSFFQIAQPENDVDAYRSKQKEAEKAEEIAITKGIIENFDLLVRKYLSENEGKADEVRAFVRKYAKGGDYRVIKEASLASKMTKDFKEKFCNEAEEKED